MVSTYTSYKLIMKDLTKSLSRTASDPIVARETKYYRDNIAKVKTVDEFLGNQRLYKYAMKAYGLEDMTYAKAFMRKVLNEGIETSTAFANKLQDPRYLAFAKAFNFAKYGASTTSFTEAQQGTVDNYVRQTLEANAGEDDQGVRLALYFQRKAPTISNAYDVLADPALLEVVRTAFNLPATGDVDAQAATIKKRLDIPSIKDGTGVAKFLQRFTSMWDAANSATSSASPALSVLSGSSSRLGLDVDLLMSLQNIRSRG